MASLPPLQPVPFVSVFTTVYNAERFVGEAIESVLSQGWPSDRLQYVVLDDGSTDGSRAAVRPYLDHITYIHQDNQGVRSAVNRAMDELHGDVIVSVAGDDVWPDGRLELLVDFLRSNPHAGMAYSDLEVIDADGATLHPSFMRMSGLTPHQGRIRAKLLSRNFVSGGGCIKRGCLKHAFHPLPPHGGWEDWWWAWTVSGVADVAYLDAPTYRYRRHDANLALGATGERLTSALRVELRFRRWMLGAVRPGEATAEDLLQGLRAFDVVATTLERETGEPRDELLPVGPEQRATSASRLHAAVRSMDAGEAAAAVLEAVAAAAADPGAEEPRALLAALAAADAPRPDLQTRSFVVLADADELSAQPQLLSAYGRCFTAADDTTLVIHASGWSAERVQAELPEIVARAGLDPQDGPDMLALPGTAADRGTLVGGADAFLGRTLATGTDGPPAFSAATVGALRALAAG